MSELNQQTDLEQARQKLEDVNARKEEADKWPLPPASTARRDIPVRKSTQKKPLKKSFGQKLKESLFGPGIDNGSIGDHIFFDIFIPKMKRVAAEMLNNGICMLFNLDPSTTRIVNSSTQTVNRHTMNASLYRDRNFTHTGVSPNTRRESIREYEWTREDAEDIFDQIALNMDQFHQVTLTDVYTFMDMPYKIRSTDSNWGWTSMNGMSIYAVDPEESRWVLDLPPVKQL